MVSAPSSSSARTISLCGQLKKADELSFTLLLEAELAEIRMQHAYRLTEWTEKRLKDDGYMLDEMTATLHRPFRAPDRPQYIYEFRKIDQSRRAKVEMSKHGFK